jgi:Domain of unknown function (DUF1905)
MITLTGPLKMWSNDEGRMHFMSVPAELAGEIKAHSLLVRRGFGSVKVEVTLDDVTWRTSVFPVRSTGGYFLPVKIDVCRKAGIAEGDEVTVEIELL